MSASVGRSIVLFGLPRLLLAPGVARLPLALPAVVSRRRWLSALSSPPGTATTPAFSADTLRHPFSMHGRVVLKKLLGAGPAAVGSTVVVGGWVRTGRSAEAGASAFVELSDGSCHQTLQCVVPKVPC